MYISYGHPSIHPSLHTHTLPAGFSRFLADRLSKLPTYIPHLQLSLLACLHKGHCRQSRFWFWPLYLHSNLFRLERHQLPSPSFPPCARPPLPRTPGQSLVLHLPEAEANSTPPLASSPTARPPCQEQICPWPSMTQEVRATLNSTPSRRRGYSPAPLHHHAHCP